jgi:hypothetical protein
MGEWNLVYIYGVSLGGVFVLMRGDLLLFGDRSTFRNRGFYFINFMNIKRPTVEKTFNIK